jgi:hypothetical protein
VALQRVVRLGADEYREEAAARIEPGWLPGIVGTHTWNREEGLTVMDGLRRVSRIGGFPARRLSGP